MKKTAMFLVATAFLCTWPLRAEAPLLLTPIMEATVTGSDRRCIFDGLGECTGYIHGCNANILGWLACQQILKHCVVDGSRPPPFNKNCDSPLNFFAFKERNGASSTYYINALEVKEGSGDVFLRLCAEQQFNESQLCTTGAPADMGELLEYGKLVMPGVSAVAELSLKDGQSTERKNEFSWTGVRKGLSSPMPGAVSIYAPDDNIKVEAPLIEVTEGGSHTSYRMFLGRKPDSNVSVTVNLPLSKDNGYATFKLKGCDKSSFTTEDLTCAFTGTSNYPNGVIIEAKAEKDTNKRSGEAIIEHRATGYETVEVGVREIETDDADLSISLMTCADTNNHLRIIRVYKNNRTAFTREYRCINKYKRLQFCDSDVVCPHPVSAQHIDEGKDAYITVTLSSLRGSSVDLLFQLTDNTSEPGDFIPRNTVRLRYFGTTRDQHKNFIRVEAQHDCGFGSDDDETFNLVFLNRPNWIAPPQPFTITIKDDDTERPVGCTYDDTEPPPEPNEPITGNDPQEEGDNPDDGNVNDDNNDSNSNDSGQGTIVHKPSPHDKGSAILLLINSGKSTWEKAL